MSDRDGRSGFGRRMNLFVCIALTVTSGFIVASILSEPVIQSLRTELDVERKRVDEKRFTIKILAGGMESRIDFMLEVLQKKRDRVEPPSN